MIAISILLCLAGTSALGYLHLTQPTASAIEKSKENKRSKRMRYRKVYLETKTTSNLRRQAVVDADMETMSAMVLSMIVNSGGLAEVVRLQRKVNDPVMVTYCTYHIGEQFSANDLQPMTAGSTYKLPLNMLVVDEVAKGKLNLTGPV